MTTRAVYNFEALTYAINRDNAILLHNYNKITKRTTIYFRCHCGEETSKGCIQIVNNAGAFCKKCTTKNGIKKLHNTISRDKPILCNIDSLKGWELDRLYKNIKRKNKFDKKEKT